MSNQEIVEKQDGEVQTWEQAVAAKAAQQNAQKAALSQKTAFISFRGGALSVDKLPIPGNQLDVIVLTFCGENTWYKGKFDPTQTQTPACWSVYTETGAMVPNEKALDMQAENCEECPKFKWGSDPQGGRGKACKSRYRVAVIPASVSTIGEVQGAELRFMTLPVTSGADFDRFMSTCQMVHNRPMFGVVSTLKVAPDVKTQYKVTLEPQRHVPGELMMAMLKRVEEAEKLIQYDYQSPEEEAAPAKPLKK